MTPEILHVASADGATAELIVHPSARDEFLYWLPALGVTARHYARFAELMATAGIGLARHEWRGAGSSNLRARRGVDWRYRDLLADVAQGLAALRAQHPAARIWIGGHSLGAQLAALTLARDSSIAGLALVAGGIPHWRRFPRWQWPLMLGLVAGFPTLAAVCGYFPGQRIGFAGREAKSLMRDWASTAWSGRYRQVLDDGDLDAELANLAHPLLALQLRDDRYAPPSSLSGLLAKLPRSRAQTQSLAPADFGHGRADHFSWMKDPQPVVQRIAQFVLAHGTDPAPLPS